MGGEGREGRWGREGRLRGGTFSPRTLESKSAPMALSPVLNCDVDVMLFHASRCLVVLYA
jgi:hypothetical protein